MAVSENLSIQFEDYPQLTFILLGRKNKTVRSLSTKKTKALLTRLNEAVLLALQTYSIDEQLLLNSFLYNNAADGFPIPIDRMETIYPHLWKPQSLLMKKLSCHYPTFLNGTLNHILHCFKQWKLMLPY